MENQKQAVAQGMDLSISTKQSIEVSNAIKGKEVQKAKEILQKIINKKKVVPFKRFRGGVGHRKGKYGPGRYPIKACTQILQIVKAAEANAKFKGLSQEKICIKEIIPNKASRPMHFGRQRGRKMKRTHIKVVIEEQEKKKEKATKEKKEDKK
ncbi:50S ribosomal protein L22 [Candidatus Woesearchaeota archaeon]|nr:50S ribosomal protein L22 [Candidatus Woesearchaeota archaeon]